MDPQARAAWHEAAVRLHRRYVLEIVEGSGLCPWAEPARARGRTRDAVFLDDDDAAIDASLVTIDQWAKDERVEVGFLLYPRLPLGARAFDAFTARLREKDAARHPLGDIPFVLAAFHPDAPLDARDAERLIPFLRRTPDPCIQLLRASVLARVRNGAPQGTQLVELMDLVAIESGAAPGAPPLRERIARANFDTAQRMGIDALRARLDAIRADRDATYARLRCHSEAARSAVDCHSEAARSAAEEPPA